MPTTPPPDGVDETPGVGASAKAGDAEPTTRAKPRTRAQKSIRIEALVIGAPPARSGPASRSIRCRRDRPFGVPPRLPLDGWHPSERRTEQLAEAKARAD